MSIEMMRWCGGSIIVQDSLDLICYATRLSICTHHVVHFPLFIIGKECCRISLSTAVSAIWKPSLRYDSLEH